MSLALERDPTQAAPPQAPTPSGAEAVIAAARRIARGPLAGLAGDIDRGLYPRAVLQQLGAAGAYGLHLHHGGRPGDVNGAIAAMAEVAQVCGATAFMVWCQQACGLYLDASDNPALHGALLDAQASGTQLGGTALSNPMKALAGIEPLLLQARRVAGGYVVDGSLPWVSNLGPDHQFGAVAQVVGEPGHEIMFLVRCDAPGVALRECPSFSGMEGTGTYGVRLQQHPVPDARLIADPLRPYVQRIRCAFILLQMGMGIGLVQAAIDSMRDVEGSLGHVNRYLHDRPDELQAEFDALGARIRQLARTPFEPDTDYVIDVLDARAEAAELGLRAAQSALLHQGARGYLMSSAVQRRVRESHFVAIVTPAIKHLRKEIARLQAPVMPGMAAKPAVAPGLSAAALA